MAGKARRARWQILPQQHRKILTMLRSGHGIRKTAAIVGVGVRTVQRRAEIIRTASLEDGEADYRRSTRPHRCPTHGLVTVWPCVACAALAHSGPSARVEAEADVDDAGGEFGADDLAERSEFVAVIDPDDLGDPQRGTGNPASLYLAPAPEPPPGAASYSQGR